MTYEVRHRNAPVAVCASLEEAFAIVRDQIDGMAPYEAAMRELSVVKVDARGRERRRFASRELVARARGVDRAELFPTEQGFDILATAAEAGWSVELAIVPDGAWHERERWSLVARIVRTDADGVVAPESVDLWYARSRREVEEAQLAAQAYLDQLDAPARPNAEIDLLRRRGDPVALADSYFAYQRTQDESLAWAWDAVNTEGFVDPGRKLEQLLALIAAAPDDVQLGLIAAGPLEDLLRYCGGATLDSVADEARRNPRLVEALRGVWLDPGPTADRVAEIIAGA